MKGRTTGQLFEARDITVAYGASRALTQTSLNIAAGEMVVLLGPSGSGKSTLLRTLAGLTPFTGSVLFAGMPVQDWRRLRRRLGYVIQDGGLFPHLTARGNVTLMARELRWPEARIAARVDELAALVALEAAQLNRYPGELSGGQRQRVALMRALMLDPDMLLLDEPLSALDPITRLRLARRLQEIFAQLGKTVVIVTHSLGEARFFGGRAILMREGRIVQQGPIADLAREPAEPFVAEFLAAEEAL